MQTATLSRADIEAHDPEGGRGGRWLCPMPECAAEHTDPRRHRSLSLVPETGLWHCHRCHAQGQIKESWKDFKPKSKKERDADLMARRRVGLEKILAKVATPDADQKTAPAPKDRFGSLSRLETSRPALAYLATRGLSSPDALAILTASGVRFAPDFGRREATETVKASSGTASVVFPLRDAKGKLIAAQGRFLKPWSSGQKFHTLGDKLAGVFATHGAMEIMQKGGPVAIVEAPLDAVTLALAGVPALALCGCNGLPEWLQRKACGRQWLIAFDADEPGDRAAESIGGVLRSLGGMVERLRPTEAKDWNEALQAGGAVWDRTAEALSHKLSTVVHGEGGEFARVRNESDPTELAEVGRESIPQLEEVGTESPHVLEQNGTENRGGLKHIETVSTPQLAQVGAVSQLAVVVAWACSEARRGFLPEPAEALPLPSGQSVAPNGAAVWLIAAESRSVGLRSHAKAFPDCALALGIVQRDMEAIAIWARHARLWEDAPYTHEGASSPLCAGACDPLEKKMMKGKS